MQRLQLTLNNRWLVAGLSLLAVVLAAQAWLASGPELAAGSRRPRPARPDSPAPAVEPAAEAAAPAPAIEIAARDPFAARPRVSLLPPIVDTAHLTALWTENGDTLALVNGRILRAGDAVGLLRIESATQEGIWVAHAQGRDFIALGGSFTLTTPAAAAVVAAAP